ncbi:restriction endonuclease subunit S [Campylobacter lanienae]|uniref:Restriction endonuclease subunit S n=1 Tax=Campylobacter lanienae TaxID=75658 RepID=A0ABY3G7C4_9BACT|nr:restriction endonuclease subunit S [Campylobacter lanienae]TWO28271.1 restriction endonuclease subunit S [Campylobacter lanienae]
MSKLEELINKLCPNGVEFKKLSELMTPNPKSKIGAKKAEQMLKGEYPFYTSGKSVYYINEHMVDGENIFVNDGGQADIKYYDGKSSYADHVISFRPINVNGKYLYYVLMKKKEYINEKMFRGSGIKNINKNDFFNMLLPVPPLEVQCEIVRILDNFTLLSAELSAELSARQKQYNFYRDALYSFKNKEVKYIKLGDIAEIIRGGNFQKKDFVEEGLPCIHYGQIYTKYGSIIDKTLTYVNINVFNKSKQAQPNDIIMAVTSENLEDVCKCVVWKGNENVAVSGHTAVIRHTINAKYLGYYFSTSHFFKDKQKLAHGTKVIEVTPSSLANVLIPVPTQQEQEKIANIIEKFDKLCNDISEGLPAEIEARKKQYEYYRDKLLTFKELK